MLLFVLVTRLCEGSIASFVTDGASSMSITQWIPLAHRLAMTERFSNKSISSLVDFITYNRPEVGYLDSFNPFDYINNVTASSAVRLERLSSTFDVFTSNSHRSL